MKQPIKTRVVNLEEGRPRVEACLLRLDRELTLSKQEKVAFLKLIHGYGSTGTGGRLREEVQKALARHKRAGFIKDFIFGEDFRISEELTWELTKKHPEVKQDRDLGKGNRGISIVLL